MNVTIYGAGKTGQYLTRVLTIEGHDVTVIEADPRVCYKLESKYDISLIESRGIKQDVFNKEVFNGCDLFIATSHVDELNIMACSVAEKTRGRQNHCPYQERRLRHDGERCGSPHPGYRSDHSP